MADSQHPDHVRIEYDVSLTDMLTASMRMHANSPDGRWSRMHLRLLIVAGALVVAGALLRQQSGASPILEWVVGALLLALAVQWYCRGVRPRMKGFDKYCGRYELEADTDGVRVQTPHGSFRYAWTGFDRLTQTHDYFFLFISPSQATWIPRRACSTEQLQCLLRLFREHVPGSV